MWRNTKWRAAGAFLIQLSASAGCGGDGAERAAQAARLATLEEEVRRLHESMNALKAAPQPAAAPAPEAAHAPRGPAFRIVCPQPWVLSQPLGAAMWTCRSAGASPEGYYPQCSVVFQPQEAIETKNYFEFAWNAAPALREIKNVKDAHVKLNDADAFEATFEADPKPLPVKVLSVLLPHGEGTYAITCAAPSGVYDKYTAGFRKIVDSFKFNN